MARRDSLVKWNQARVIKTQGSSFTVFEVRKIIEIIKQLKTRHSPSIFEEFLKCYPNKRYDSTSNMISQMKDKLKMGMMTWDEELYTILSGKRLRKQVKKLVHIIQVDDNFAMDIYYNTKQIISGKYILTKPDSNNLPIHM